MIICFGCNVFFGYVSIIVKLLFNSVGCMLFFEIFIIFSIKDLDKLRLMKEGKGILFFLF